MNTFRKPSGALMSRKLKPAHPMTQLPGAGWTLCRPTIRESIRQQEIGDRDRHVHSGKGWIMAGGGRLSPDSASRLTTGEHSMILIPMKSGALWFCLALTLTGIAVAEQVITPAHPIELFNGKDFSGWTFCMSGNADPFKTWSVTNDVIHCTGKPTGYLRTTQAYSNYVVTVVWRFVKVAPKADNTGVLVHMQLPDNVWPMCVQNQGKSGRQGDLFVMAGAECKEHLALGKDANTPVPLKGEPNENPIGEWNTNVTICAGNDVKAVINGKFLNEITECTVSSGFIGIQSEGGDIEIRKISLKSLSGFQALVAAP